MHGSRQQRIIRLLQNRLILLLLIVGVILLIPPVWGAFEKERESGRNNQAAQARLADLTAREAALGVEVDRLSSERGLEGELRDQFDVGEAGERVIYIVERSATSGDEAGAEKNGFGAWVSSWWPF